MVHRKSIKAQNVKRIQDCPKMAHFSYALTSWLISKLLLADLSKTYCILVSRTASRAKCCAVICAGFVYKCLCGLFKRIRLRHSLDMSVGGETRHAFVWMWHVLDMSHSNLPDGVLPIIGTNDRFHCTSLAELICSKQYFYALQLCRQSRLKCACFWGVVSYFDLKVCDIVFRASRQAFL